MLQCQQQQPHLLQEANLWLGAAAPRGQLPTRTELHADGRPNLLVPLRGQRNVLLLPPERFDFFGKVERYAEDWAQVLRGLQGLEPGTASTPGIFDNATGANDKLARYYTPELAERVARLYRADFAAFGYDAGALPVAAVAQAG